MKVDRDVIVAATAAGAGLLAGLWLAIKLGKSSTGKSEELIPESDELLGSSIADQLKELTRAAAGNGHGATMPELPKFRVCMPVRRPLSQAEKEAFSLRRVRAMQGIFLRC